MACFAWANDAVAACFDGGMNIPMQCIKVLIRGISHEKFLANLAKFHDTGMIYVHKCGIIHAQ